MIGDTSTLMALQWLSFFFRDVPAVAPCGLGAEVKPDNEALIEEAMDEEAMDEESKVSPTEDNVKETGVAPPPTPPPPPRSCRTMDKAEVAGLQACLRPPQPPCPPPLRPNPAPPPIPAPPPPPPVSVSRRGEDVIPIAEWERLLDEEMASQR